MKMYRKEMTLEEWDKALDEHSKRVTVSKEGDSMANNKDKSMIMNVRTLRASGQPVPPYNEVMAFLAEQNKTQMPQDLLMFDQETLAQMPDELREAIIELHNKYGVKPFPGK